MTFHEGVNAPAAKMEIARTVVGAYQTWLRNLWPFAKIAAIPLVLWVLLSMATAQAYPLMSSEIAWLFGPETSIVLDYAGLEELIQSILLAMATILFFSHWLQFLNPPGTRSRRATVSFWSRRDWQLLRYVPLLLAPALVSFTDRLLYVLADVIHLPFFSWDLAEWIPYLGFWTSVVFVALLGVILDALLMGRFGLVFVAAAEGRPMRLGDARRITRGQTLRLMSLWVLLYWAFPSLFRLMYLETVLNAEDLLGVDLATLQQGLSASAVVLREAVQLPLAITQFVAIALGATLLLGLYRRHSGAPSIARDDLLERFE